MTHAAAQGISITALKKSCRDYGLKRWPYSRYRIPCARGFGHDEDSPENAVSAPMATTSSTTGRPACDLLEERQGIGRDYPSQSFSLHSCQLMCANNELSLSLSRYSCLQQERDSSGSSASSKVSATGTVVSSQSSGSTAEADKACLPLRRWRTFSGLSSIRQSIAAEGLSLISARTWSQALEQDFQAQKSALASEVQSEIAWILGFLGENDLYRAPEEPPVSNLKSESPHGGQMMGTSACLELPRHRTWPCLSNSVGSTPVNHQPANTSKCHLAIPPFRGVDTGAVSMCASILSQSEKVPSHRLW